jgi:hypothetical protein
MTRVGIIALAIALSIACGKSEAEKQAEQAAADAQKAAEAAAKAAEQGNAAASKEVQDFAKAMQGMAAALSGAAGGDGKVVEPVDFRQLQTALPEVSGWTMDKPRGEKITVPVTFSAAEASYEKGDANIDVKILDSAFNQILIAGLSTWFTVGYEKDTGDGYEKSVNVAGHPGLEKWDRGSNSGELNLVIAKRFLVTIDGNDLPDAKVLHEFASKIDTAKLASLK